MYRELLVQARELASAILDALLGLESSIEKKFFLVCLLTWNTLAGR